MLLEPLQVPSAVHWELHQEEGMADDRSAETEDTDQD